MSLSDAGLLIGVILIGWCLATLFAGIVWAAVGWWNMHRWDAIRAKYREEYVVHLKQLEARRGYQADTDSDMVILSEFLDEREIQRRRMN